MFSNTNVIDNSKNGDGPIYWHAETRAQATIIPTAGTELQHNIETRMASRLTASARRKPGANIDPTIVSVFQSTTFPFVLDANYS